VPLRADAVSELGQGRSDLVFAGFAPVVPVGTRHAARFVETGLLWQSSAFVETGPADCRKTIAGFCKTADRMVDGNC